MLSLRIPHRCAPTCALKHGETMMREKNSPAAATIYAQKRRLRARFLKGEGVWL